MTHYLHQFILSVTEAYPDYHLRGKSIKPVAMFIASRFTGIPFWHLRVYFRLTWLGINSSMWKARKRFESGDPKFIKLYNEILDIYIQSLRSWAAQNKIK